jgi:hypothetical protein
VGAHTITGAHLVGLGCVRIGNSKECPQKSPGASGSGEIVSTTLKGELGTVKTSEAASGVGLLLAPESGARFYTLAETACGLETAVTGKLAGEVSPIGHSQTTSKVIFGVTSGKQDIKAISVLGAVVEPELVAFSDTVTEEASESLSFGSAVEVS